jgi:diguanylate cyclase (GGDEF)-like protein
VAVVASIVRGWLSVLARPQRWSLWQAPRLVVALVLTIDLAAVAVSGFAVIASSSPARSTLVRFGLIVALSLFYGECSRQVERSRRLLADREAHVDMTAMWVFAALIVLPGDLAILIVAFVFIYTQVRNTERGETSPPHRVFFNISVAVLSAMSARGIIHFFGLDPGAGVRASALGLLVLVAAALLYDLVASLAVGTVVSLSRRKFGTGVYLGTGRQHLLLLATLVLGTFTAAAVGTAPWFAVLVLPAAFLLQHHELLSSLVEAATTDAKTDLLNAAAWRQLAERELSKATRDGSASAVLVIDMDHFKAVNDTAGHLAGDAALKAVAAALTEELRGYDAVGRFGGEEFVALLPGVDVRLGARIADRARRRIESLQIASGGKVFGVTASIGVAAFPEHGLELDDILQAADQALYTAKTAGRNIVCAAVEATSDSIVS